MIPLPLPELPPRSVLRCSCCGERIESKDEFGRCERICRSCRGR